MAIYHLSARGVSPARGSSAVKTSAYISGLALTDERTGEECRYRRAERVAAIGLAMPEGAPAWDRQRLWNEAGSAHAGGNELTAKAYEFALPRELDADARLACVADFCADFTARGLACDWAVHDSGDGNPHAHVLVSALRLGPDGFERPSAPRSQKHYICRDADGREWTVRAADWKAARADGLAKVYNFKDGRRRTMGEARAEGLTADDRASKSPVAVCKAPDGSEAFEAEKAELKRIRKMWADVANKRLAEHAAERREPPATIDHRSHEDRGLDEVPHIHVGRTRSPERAARNRAIDAANRAIAAARDGIAALAAASRAWWARRADEAASRRREFIAGHRARAMAAAAARARLAAPHGHAGPAARKPIGKMTTADLMAALGLAGPPAEHRAADPHEAARRIAAELSAADDARRRGRRR